MKSLFADFQPDRVVTPGSAQEVQEIIRKANRDKTPLVPVSSGTNLQDTHLPSVKGATAVDLSRLKGGQLARAAAPARVISLILSDVIGDRLDVIASGPTAPDPTTFGDALAVLDRRGVRAAAPPSVLARLQAGVRGEVPETPKPRRARRKAEDTGPEREE